MSHAKGFRIILLFLLIAIAILIPFFIFEDTILAWLDTTLNTHTGARWTIAGILFSALSLDIFLPVPSSLISTLCGQCFGICYGAFLSFAAMTTSSLIGYGLGRCSQKTAKRFLGEGESAMLSTFFNHYGMPILIALRTLPILAEASVLFAGLARYRFFPTLCATLLGNALISLLYALVGHWGHETYGMTLAFLGAIGLSGLLLLFFWLHQKKNRLKG